MPALRRVVHAVRDLSLGDTTRYEGGHLTVGEDAVRAAFADPALAQVRAELASPGERVRIVAPLDVVEPRTKGPGGGGIFPGTLAEANGARGPETHVLRGAAVTAAGFLPRNQEGLVDLSGPAADLSPFGSTHNVVITFDPDDGASWEEVEAALRHGLLRLAADLAEAALEAPPDDVEELAEPRHAGHASDGLPRVGAITNLQSQGAFKDVFVYGDSPAGWLPTLFDPAAVEDGAVTSGQYGHPALRNPTYVHQNHPLVSALRARDGEDLHFAGMILCPEPVSQAGKERVSAHAAWLCQAAGFDAVAVTKEGGGNADNDISLKVDALEDAGISAIGLYAEMSGADGTGPPVVAPPRRGAMVSTGNYDQRLELPAVDRAIGSDRLDVAGADATAAVTVPVATVLCALSPLGWGRLTCREETA